jgi:hypothetical protein
LAEASAPTVAEEPPPAVTLIEPAVVTTSISAETPSPVAVTVVAPPSIAT